MKRAYAARHFNDINNVQPQAQAYTHWLIAGYWRAGVDQISRHVRTCIVRPALLPGTTVGPVTKQYKRQKVDSVALDTTEPSFGHVA